MFEPNTPVIIKGYCGVIIDFELNNIAGAIPICNITLRDLRDPRITIVMEDIYLNEIQQNPVS